MYGEKRELRLERLTVRALTEDELGSMVGASAAEESSECPPPIQPGDVDPTGLDRT